MNHAVAKSESSLKKEKKNGKRVPETPPAIKLEKDLLKSQLQPLAISPQKVPEPKNNKL